MMVLLSLIILLVLVWFSHRYCWWAPAVDYSLPRVLMYHMISAAKPGTRFNGLRVSPADFERQLAWLHKHGWQFVTMSELVAAPGGPKTVAITFDDGYADNLVAALPLLEKYDARATVYLVIDRHDNDWSTQKKAHHDSGELMHEPKLDDEQVRKLLASSRIELGSHTFSHGNLSKLDYAQKRHEIIAARQHLAQQFNVPVTSFAYPFGIYDETDVALAREAGYTTAVTTDAGIDALPERDWLKLKRVKISGKDNFLAFRMRMKTGKRGWFK